MNHSGTWDLRFDFTSHEPLGTRISRLPWTTQGPCVNLVFHEPLEVYVPVYPSREPLYPRPLVKESTSTTDRLRSEKFPRCTESQDYRNDNFSPDYPVPNSQVSPTPLPTPLVTRTYRPKGIETL